MLKLFRRKATDPRKELQAALGDCTLPSFPAIITTTLEKVRQPDTPVPLIADMVARDPGLSARLLRTVNSPAFGLRHEVRSVHHAVSLLGRSQLESILISMAVGTTLPREPSRGYEPTRFWTTAAKRAATASALADRIDPSKRSESFTASLLQDLALPMLSHHKRDEYGPLLEHWHNSTDDLVELERREFGWDHAGIGAAICAEWSFPEQQARAIAGHHDAPSEEPRELPAVRLVAVLREVDEDAGIERLVETAREHHGVPADDSLGLVRSSFATAAEISRLFV